MKKTTLKIPRSEKLTKEEVSMLKAHLKKYPSGSQAAIAIKIDRMVLNRVIAYGSGHPSTVSKIRAFFNSENIEC